MQEQVKRKEKVKSMSDDMQVKVTRWSGKYGEWYGWKRQFKAFCDLKRCGSALVDGGFYLPHADAELVDPANPQALEAREANRKAMLYLTLFITNPEDVGVLDQ